MSVVIVHLKNSKKWESKWASPKRWADQASIANPIANPISSHTLSLYYTLNRPMSCSQPDRTIGSLHTIRESEPPESRAACSDFQWSHPARLSNFQMRPLPCSAIGFDKLYQGKLSNFKKVCQTKSRDSSLRRLPAAVSLSFELLLILLLCLTSSSLLVN